MAVAGTSARNSATDVPRRALLAIAAASALAMLPGWAVGRLGDPGYWGVAAYLFATVILLRSPSRGWGPGGSKRTLIRIFLIALPSVYVAYWLRFGEGFGGLALETAGLVVWVALAIGSRGRTTLLWLGCVVHALWDALHFGRTEYVPDWYAAVCVVADMAIGCVALISLGPNTPAEAAEPA